MNVTDSQRAGAASTFIVAGLGAYLGLSLLSYVVNWVVPGSYEGAWPIISELFALGATAVLLTGVIQLAGAVSDGTVLRILAALLILDALLGLGITLVLRKLDMGGIGLMAGLAFDASLAVSLLTRGLLIFAIIQLTTKTHAWVVALLGVVAVLTLMRSALSAALNHQLIDYAVYGQPVFRFAMPVVSLFNGVAMLVGALTLKSAVSAATAPGPGTQALVAAAGLRPAEPEPISPVSDFLVGGILLLVGIGVTVVSMQAASNGGRYIVATGAIGVGLGRIIRGLVRAGRSSSSP